MDNAKYKCNDIFMVRTPSLPYNIYLSLENDYNSDAENLINDYNLYDFFSENLFISSKSLYNSFCKYSIRKETGKSKKILSYKESILKYLIRSTIRPTPFAGFSRVGLGEFKQVTDYDYKKIQLYSNDTFKRIDADNSWIHSIIKKFENDDSILEQLYIKINPLCYRSGNRFKNPFFSNMAFTTLSKESSGKNIHLVSDNNIKFSPLIEFIKKERNDLILFSTLSKKISNVYRDVDSNIIKNTLITLIKKEFLLTELRTNIITENPLKNLIKKLNTLELSIEYDNILKKLKKIDSLIDTYNINYDFKNLISATSFMESVCSSDTYFIYNSGIKFINNKLDLQIKKDLEEFIEVFKYLSLGKADLNKFYSIAEEFQEYYGTNEEIPFIDFIDSNKFDGINKIKNKENSIMTKKEDSIKKLLDKKISEYILRKNDEINISKEDVLTEEFLSYSNSYPLTFDMNFIITKKIDGSGYNYYIGPNWGANEGGASFQRFKDVFDKDLFDKYCSLYKHKVDYEYVEIREINNHGRIANIFNRSNNYTNVIDFGLISDSNTINSLKLEDLYIGVDTEGFFYFTYNDQKVKFVLDNMFNSNLLNNVAYVLHRISSCYNDSLLSRTIMLSSINKYFSPRIVISNVVVSPKTWFLYSEDFPVNDFYTFKCKLDEYLNSFCIDKILYLKDNDNRIVINLNKEIYKKIIFDELRKKTFISLSEIETGIFHDSIINDEHNMPYVSEFIFTFSKDIDSNKNMLSKKVSDKNRTFNLFDDGWIYIKLYGVYDREKDLFASLTNYLYPRLDNHKFFFIRYTDKLGDHLRFRFKFENSGIAAKNMMIINSWIKDLQSDRIIGEILYDCYKRESNRYGGSNLINKAEDCFDADSKFVISLLDNYDFSNPEVLEKYFFIGILSILKIFIPEINQLKDLLSNLNSNLSIKREFHKKSYKYIKLVEEVYDENRYFELDNKTEKCYLFRNDIFHKFKQALDTENILYKENIYLSFSHMFCNRLYGDRNYEDKIMQLIYLSLEKYIKRNSFK